MKHLSLAMLAGCSLAPILVCQANSGTLVEADNNTAMASMSVTTYPFVARYGFANYGDSPVTFYKATTAACPLNSGAGDGGSQVPGSGGCYLIMPREHYDVSIWGVNPQQNDNGPFMDKVWSWAATANAGSSSQITANLGGGGGTGGTGTGNPYTGTLPAYGGGGAGGVSLTMAAGGYYFASSFDCHGAQGVSLQGTGDDTVWFRDTDYGDTMTCSHGSNMTIGHVWAQHFIGVNPIAGVSHGTGPWVSSSHGTTAHFHFNDVNNFDFDHVTAWNMNYNFEIFNGSFGRWEHPKTMGYWDSTHRQTIASFYFDGYDGQNGASSIHPTLMTIIDPILGSYGTSGSKTLTSGSQSRTISASTGPAYQNFNLNFGPLDHILVYSMEGLFVGSGGNASGASRSTLHLAPRATTTVKPILNITADGFYFDSVGDSSVLIENGGFTPGAHGGGTCANPSDGSAWGWASNVHISSGDFNGEYTGNHAVNVPESFTPWPGEAGAGSAQTTTCGAVAGLYINNMNGVAVVQSPYTIGAALGGVISGGGFRNYNAWGVYSNDVAQSSAAWLYCLTQNFHVIDFAAGGGNNFEPISGAPGPSNYGSQTQTMYGVSIQSGLTNVTRQNIKNDGYYQDWGGPVPTATCYKPDNTWVPGASLTLSSDNSGGKVVIPNGTEVTWCNINYNGYYSSTANVRAHVTDAQNQYGYHVGAAIQGANGSGGFSVLFDPTATNGSSANLGVAGGSFEYSVDGNN